MREITNNIIIEHGQYPNTEHYIITEHGQYKKTEHYKNRSLIMNCHAEIRSYEENQWLHYLDKVEGMIRFVYNTNTLDKQTEHT